jgi:hypothetical protein
VPLYRFATVAWWATVKALLQPKIATFLCCVCANLCGIAEPDCFLPVIACLKFRRVIVIFFANSLRKMILEGIICATGWFRPLVFGSGRAAMQVFSDLCSMLGEVGRGLDPG